MDPGNNKTYEIGELSDLSGLSVRTIRYYIQQRLLPPSPTMGPGAKYRGEHLTRLRLIRHFQRQNLSLAEIGKKLESADLVGATDPSANSSAEAYVRAALGSGSATLPAGLLDELPSTAQSEPADMARTFWERVALTNDIEIHVRRPLNRADNRNVERLLDAAKEIFGEQL